MFIHMRDLTLEEVIIEGMKLWYWLYLNPEANKDDWPGWEIVEDYDATYNDCFPCTYTEHVVHADCEDCVLANKYCMGEGYDVFGKWSKSRGFMKKELAWQMVEGHFEIELPYD